MRRSSSMYRGFDAWGGGGATPLRFIGTDGAREGHFGVPGRHTDRFIDETTPQQPSGRQTPDLSRASTDPARSFDAWAPDYDRYRPGYPDALFDEIATRLELPERPHVADLGAGTGRATLAMAELGWRVTAVEPGRPMLDILRARASERGLVVATVQGHAEETGLDPRSVDLAAAAQAFHWFDKPRAVAEMARIVRPGGGVALFWNTRDEASSPFVADYHAMLERYVGPADTGRYLQAGRATGRKATRAAFDGVQAWDCLELSEVHHAVEMTGDAFVGMAFTASYVRAMAPDEQATFRTELTDLLARHRLADEPFSIPYRIDLWTARRIDRDIRNQDGRIEVPYNTDCWIAKRSPT